MKAFRFIKRYGHSDWLQVINADSIEEAISLYDFNDDNEYEVKEMEDRKGCVLAFHIMPNQATIKG